jgi:Holliday junction DNA helicase RuvA
VIATLTGLVAERDGESLVVQTDGGVGYAVSVPVGVAQRLPSRGARVSLFTELVVKEDGWSLYGFDSSVERLVFRHLLSASGFGPKLALALLSALGPERTVRSIQARDLSTLSSVSGIGRKKAERLVLELRDRFSDVVVEANLPRVEGSEDAVRALVGLGYGIAAADDAVRTAKRPSSFVGHCSNSPLLVEAHRPW